MSDGPEAEALTGKERSDERSDRIKPTRERTALVKGFAAMMRSGPAVHPIYEKMEPGHVTQIIDSAFARDRDRARQLRTDRWFRLFYAVLGIGMFVFLTLWLLPDQADLYVKLLQGLGLFFAGGAGGYGLKSYQLKNR